MHSKDPFSPWNVWTRDCYFWKLKKRAHEYFLLLETKCIDGNFAVLAEVGYDDAAVRRACWSIIEAETSGPSAISSCAGYRRGSGLLQNAYCQTVFIFKFFFLVNNWNLLILFVSSFNQMRAHTHARCTRVHEPTHICVFMKETTFETATQWEEAVGDGGLMLASEGIMLGKVRFWGCEVVVFVLSVWSPL